MYIVCHGAENTEAQRLEIPPEGIFIGSDAGNEIVIPEIGISGRHIRLFVHEQDLFLEDADSEGMTFLNGEHILEKVRLASGDGILIGISRIHFEKKSGENGEVFFELFLDEPETFLPDVEEEPPKEEEPKEYSTAMTVMPGANIKELLEAGNFDELQNSNPNMGTGRTILGEGWEIGKYKIVRKIGQGGMGVIYLAKHQTLNAYRALKVIPMDTSVENNPFFERFLREARMASEIHHPNVVEVMDVETDSSYGVSYIVMEYIDGGSLRRVLKSQKKLSLEQAVVIVHGVASALSAATERKIVHRDIKPDNIMFTKRGDVKLADLGIAKNDNDDANLTKTNVMIGTPAYLSPEQVENSKSVDIRSDIYSLGVTFYEMLTGQQPYVGTSTYDLLHKLFSEPVPNPRDKNPEISVEIARIVMKMMDKDPKRRFQSPEEFLTALEQDGPQYTASEGREIVKGMIVGASLEGGLVTPSNSSIVRRRMEDRKRNIRILGLFACFSVLVIIGASSILQRDKLAERWKKLFIQEKNIEDPGMLSRPLPVAPAAQVVPGEPALFSLSINAEANTEIRLISAAGAIATYMTNDNGLLKIENLHPGEYSVLAKCRGRQDYSSSISLKGDRSLFIQMLPTYKSATFSTVPGSTLTLSGKRGLKKSVPVPASGIVKFPELPQDMYSVLVVCDGYLPEEQEFTLDDDVALPVKLRAIYAKLRVTTTPHSTVELFQDGIIKYSDKADAAGICALENLPKGAYMLKVFQDNFQSRESKVELVDELRLNLLLAPVVKKITLHAPPYSIVRIQQNNKIIKEANVSSSGKILLTDLPVGKYEVFFSKDGYQPTSENISLFEDLTLNISLKPIQSASQPQRNSRNSSAVVSYGSVSIGIEGGPELLEYIKKNGSEIRINDGAWKKIAAIPHTEKLPVGKARIRIRATGIQPVPTEQVVVEDGEASEVVFGVIPMPSKVIFASNIENAKFFFRGFSYACKDSVTVEPFKQYPLTVEAGGFDTKEITFSAQSPGAAERFFVQFDDKVVPMGEEYKEGMNLFKEKNYEEALKLLTAAGEGGNPDAAYQAATMYENGQGIRIWFSRKSKALEWYRLAAKHGHKLSAFISAEAIRNGDYTGTGKEMFDLYLQAASGQHTQATYQLFLLYDSGTPFLEADEKQAAHFLTLSADLGSPEAMFEMAMRYEKGKGVQTSSENAIKWYKKAAAAGMEKAAKRVQVLDGMGK